MKLVKYITLLICCSIITACSGEDSKLDSFKTKMLESVAVKHKTTPEMLVKDLDVKIDSMSLSPFLVEDSLALVQKQYDDFIAEKESQLASSQKSVTKLEQELKTASGISKLAKASSLDNFKRIHHNIEVELNKGKAKYEKLIATFENRDPKEVIYTVFQYRVSLKNPLTGIHMTDKDISYFTPDGQKLIDGVSVDIKKYIISKEK